MTHGEPRIDPFVDNWLDELKAYTVTAAQQRMTLVLLIDGAFDDGVWPALSQRTDCIALFGSKTTASEELLRASPVLVSWSDSRSMRLVLKSMNGQPMISAIATPESVERLAERLSSWCRIRTDGMVFNFRFSDTRRLPAVLRVLTAAQRARMLGPATHWYFVNRMGQW